MKIKRIKKAGKTIDFEPVEKPLPPKPILKTKKSYKGNNKFLIFYYKITDYIKTSKFYVNFKFVYLKKIQDFIFKFIYVLVWSLFLLSSLHLFNIVSFNVIHYLETISLYFIIQEIIFYINSFRK